ncbi:MAG: hypothetical protein BMS9Abin02_0135 [Anaerolineae bacterium]|nr:MAG: hypothetical protein BMS9Abin02_0135 [Anaerolineae bacterium]
MSFGLIVLFIQLLIPPKIEIKWETESEFDTAGFNIYRSDDKFGPFEQINNTLIPSSSDAATGGSYSFIDENVRRDKTYYYRLEDVEFDNSKELHEQIFVTAPTFSWIGIVLASLSVVTGLILIGVYLWRK